MWPKKMNNFEMLQDTQNKNSEVEDQCKLHPFSIYITVREFSFFVLQ
jgi:hypothetical protein